MQILMLIGSTLHANPVINTVHIPKESKKNNHIWQPELMNCLWKFSLVVYSTDWVVEDADHTTKICIQYK